MAIVSPSFCSGRELWRLGVPRTVSSDDPAMPRGAVSPITKVVATGVGTLTLLGGWPWDTYQIRVEIVTGGAPGVASARGSLNGGTTWQPTTTIAEDGSWLLDESGLLLGFGGTQAALDAWTLTTTEAAAQAQVRRIAGAEICRWFRQRGLTPPTEWGDDFTEINAVLAAWRLLEGKRGFESDTEQRRGLLARVDKAWKDLYEIGEEIQQTDLGGQDKPAGLRCESDCPQGRDLW